MEARERDRALLAGLFGEPFVPRTPTPEQTVVQLPFAPEKPVRGDEIDEDVAPGGALHAALSRLRRETVWSAAEARRILGPLEPLAEADLIVVAASTIGRLVTLGNEGRRWLNMNPYTTFTVEPLENLLYFRLAARQFDWKTEREPYLGAARSVGRLDRLPIVWKDGQKMFVMARTSASGYQAEAVGKVFRSIRSFLLADRAVLVVVTPSPSKLGKMRSRGGLLKVVEYKVVPEILASRC
ncbi:hypothetical protein Q0M94_10770 [Deinococcus radiomollis]|uniref:hypothetical protein n=1 Tax=Deinococcus radiomollis TaxID=468916 RepID=UPI003892C284